MIANDMDQDHSGAMTKIAIFFVFKIVRITIFVILSSYFLGIIFFMICESNMIDEHLDGADDYFIREFKILNKTPKEIAILTTYYLFTTMSTVGFGDLYPISDKERIFLIFLLFSGVLLFAQIQGHYHQTYEEIGNFFQDFDDCDELERFFDLIKSRYNGDQDINPDLKLKIE